MHSKGSIRGNRGEHEITGFALLLAIANWIEYIRTRYLLEFVSDRPVF